MLRARITTLLSAAALAATSLSLNAGTVANPQASQRPFGLQPISSVQVSGSDARAAEFNSVMLPQFLQICEDNLQESVVFQQSSGFKLDASKLFLRQNADKPIRIYYIMEGAGYWNTLGFTITPAGATNNTGSPFLIFPNASAGSTRTQNEPLRTGDFVEIGTGTAGFQLDFFLISDGARNGQTWLYNDKSRNSDGLQHVVAFLIPGSRYVMIGFEDIVGGGDLDYNDLVFVVDIGAENALCLDVESDCLPH
jgi:hypothetical protein